MPWGEVIRASLREEFIQLAMQSGANRRELCRRFKISPKTAYKWLRRLKSNGKAGLNDLSRPPARSPKRTDPATEQEVLSLCRQSLNCWGWTQTGAVCWTAAVPNWRPARSPRSCIAMVSSNRNARPPQLPGNASRARYPTNCGRWTLRATSRCSMGSAAIP